MRMSIAWPDDVSLVARVMVKGRFRYEGFTVTTEDETADRIVEWAHAQTDTPSSGKTP